MLMVDVDNENNASSEETNRSKGVPRDEQGVCQILYKIIKT